MVESQQKLGLLTLFLFGIILFCPVNSNAPKYLLLLGIISGIAWFLNK